ncbi:lipopolysaccharide export system permease protein [Tepidamorphus gemmatus]|uniref:Lipopolysaccharide export system permease protein n=1 Tax=Tepidamorphus gemmatus TaxID=747076 RepID=A0A4R3ME06_9HYPH|nr:LPS export ABC transporter permease LptG [Tepidamorphus gemmatus]TCT11372.1 lipopolysaccharide export system permease protein [Tepidamorphus gemmatus]
MSTSTMMRYVSRRYVLNLAGVFGTCLALIFLIDSVENLRRAGNHDVSFGTVLLLSLYRLPSLSELVLPFAVLFAAMATFLMLTKSLELVVARSVGVSVWQFSAPVVFITLIVGIAATTLYNPLAANFKARHEALFEEAFGDSAVPFGGAGVSLWLRQDGVDGQSVLRARRASADGLKLRHVTAIVFDSNGGFAERVEARNAVLEEGRWRLNAAWLIQPGRPPEYHKSYLLSTYLTREQVSERLASAQSISFWDLPSQIEIAQRAGLPAVQYRLQYQSLLARPLLLCAMVLIAATVSLRVFRFGNIGRMILGGVVAGFVLYVVSNFVRDLGTAGAVTPVAAAWTPALVTMLLGTTVLLYQEDG